MFGNMRHFSDLNLMSAITVKIKTLWNNPRSVFADHQHYRSSKLALRLRPICSRFVMTRLFCHALLRKIQCWRVINGSLITITVIIGADSMHRELLECNNRPTRQGSGARVSLWFRHNIFCDIRNLQN